MLGSAFAPALDFVPLCPVEEAVSHNGLSTLAIDTATGKYYYDVDGGGFASIIDNDGNDWISWNSAFGSGSGT